MSAAPVHVVLTGATGRTGNAVAHALASGGFSGVQLHACVAPSVASTPTRSLPAGVPSFATLAEAFDTLGVSAGTHADDVVLVDLTHAEPSIEHAALALDRGVRAVIGATGFASDTITDLGARFDAAGLALFVVPNFSLGAVLGMQLAQTVAAHFPDVEVIEAHHDGKRDSPSGTAVHTAQLIAQARRDAGTTPGPGVDSAAAGNEPARGELIDGVPVHALRLPGVSASQEVVFGSPGELLTIRHDVIDRSAYATGVALAARSVVSMRGLNIGLEHAL